VALASNVFVAALGVYNEFAVYNLAPFVAIDFQDSSCGLREVFSTGTTEKDVVQVRRV